MASAVAPRWASCGVNRAIFFAIALWSWAAGLAAAECLSAPALTGETATGPITTDRSGHLVAPVMVNGQGPFRFIVDTGANRSVLSRGLAERLGLVTTGTGLVHSIDGSREAPLAQISSLRYGDLDLPSGPMPLMDSPVLAGEQGLLGVDGMRGRRLLLDFEQRCIEIAPSRDAASLHRWTMVRGQLRFGHLVVVRGSVSGLRGNILIDTGADTSLANTALQEALRVRLRHDETRFRMNRAHTVAQTVVLDNAVVLSDLKMGELELDNVIAFVGDYHIFSLWGLTLEPTLLIGMDVLSQTRGLAIDYASARVFFRVDERRNRRR